MLNWGLSLPVTTILPVRVKVSFGSSMIERCSHVRQAGGNKFFFLYLNCLLNIFFRFCFLVVFGSSMIERCSHVRQAGSHSWKHNVFILKKIVLNLFSEFVFPLFLLAQ